MKQYAIIGASNFGKQILEELVLLDCEVILIDKDHELIDVYKNDVTAAYIADVINEDVIRKLIPPDIDAVVVDLGDKTEASILVTKYLQKLGIPNIIVKAETEEHGEILEIVGATFVVFPNREAAKRVTPLLVSDLLFNFLPISGGLVMAETGVPDGLVGTSEVETDLRRKQGINIVAFRRGGTGEYLLISPEYRLSGDDILLIAGREEDITEFAGQNLSERRRGLADLFKQFFTGARIRRDPTDGTETPKSDQES